MISKVLVAIDYSVASLNALDTAVAITAGTRADLTLLHIIETDNYTQPDAGHSQLRMSVAEAMATQIAQKHGLDTDLLFQEGYAGPGIVQAAMAQEADLILLGAHGASGKRDWFIGSNAYYVLKNAHCPVLIIPENEKWMSFDHILLPARTRFAFSQKYAFIQALQLAGPICVDILAFSTDKEWTEAVAPATSRKNKGMTNTASLEVSIHFSEEKNIAREILKKAAQDSVNLIILSPGIDVISKQFFIGPFCQRVLHHARVPVLYLR